MATLRVTGELSQADLSRHTNLSRATVSNIVHQLEDAGMVVSRISSGRRRLVQLAKTAGFVIGVDYGHRHVTVAVADLSSEILTELHEDFGADQTADGGLRLAAHLLTRVLGRAGVDKEEILSTTIGLPAPIEAASGLVGSPTILPTWVGLQVSQMAADIFGLTCPILVDNDANLGALAEHRWGAGIGVPDMAYLKLSEGVGAGLIMNGRLHSGPQGTAGEIGHVTADEYGELCRCGNRGCLETLVSARQVALLLAPTHGPDLTITEVVRLADNGDRACARVLEDTGSQVGIAVANLCSLMNPELVVVGGELAQADEYLVPAIERVVNRRVAPAATQRLRVTTAALAGRAQVLGAIARSLELLPMQ